MRTQFWGGSQTAPSTSALNFGSLVQAGRGFLTVEASAAQVCSVAGLLHSFQVRMETAPGAGKQWTFTVRKNGVDTGLAIVVSGTATTGFIASSVSVAAGDWLTVSIQPSGTPTVPGTTSWASSFDSTSANESPLLSCTFGTTMNVSSVTSCAAAQGTNVPTTTAVNADGIVPVAGSITGFRVRFPAAVSVGTWKVFLVKNGVDTAMTATITGGASTAASTGSAVAFATGDLIRFRVLGTSTPVAQVITIGATFAPTVDGNSFYIGGQLSLSNSSSLFYFNGPSPDTGNATALNRASLSNGCSITALYAQAKTAPVGGDSWTYNLLKNEAQVATVSTTTANVVSSTGLSVTVADADRLEMGHVPAGTPAASISIWSVAIFVQPGVIATNESGEASSLTGLGGFQGLASTNESGEASALAGIYGYAATAQTNSGGAATSGQGASGFSGDVETDSAGVSTAGTGAFGFDGDVETDSAGVRTDGAGTFGFAGDLETDSGGVTTAGTGTTGAVEDSVATNQGGLETSGAGTVGSAALPPEREPSGWTGRFTRLRRKLKRKRAPRVIITLSIEGRMRTLSGGNATSAVGEVGIPRPVFVPPAQLILPVAPPVPAPPAPKSFLERIIPKKSKPRAISGRASTVSPGISSKGKAEVGGSEEEMLMAAIMIMEEE